MERDRHLTTLDRLNEASRVPDIGSGLRPKQPTTLEKLQAAVSAVGEAAGTAKDRWESLSISGGAVLATAAGVAPFALGGIVAFRISQAALSYLSEKRKHERESARGEPEGARGGATGGPALPPGPSRPSLGPGPVRPALPAAPSPALLPAAPVRLALPPAQGALAVGVRAAPVVALTSLATVGIPASALAYVAAKKALLGNDA